MPMVVHVLNKDRDMLFSHQDPLHVDISEQIQLLIIVQDLDLVVCCKGLQLIHEL